MLKMASKILTEKRNKTSLAELTLLVFSKINIYSIKH